MKTFVPTRKRTDNKLTHVATKCGKCDGASPFIGGKNRVEKYKFVAKK